MQEVYKLKVYAEDSREENYSTAEIHVNTTAEELLSTVSPKLLGLSANQLQEYALFLIILNSESNLKERMLAPFECPLQIIVTPT